MTLTGKMLNMIFAYLMADLKPGVAKKKEDAEKRGVGKKWKQYQTSRITGWQDVVEFIASIFGNTVEVENEVEGFGKLARVEGHIPNKFKKEYLFVKTARAPDKWVQGFVVLNTLSAMKIEEAKYACH